MRSFEIFVDPTAVSTKTLDDTVVPSSRAQKKRPREVIDVFVHGANVTAAVGERQGRAVLRDLGLAVANLAQNEGGKEIVRFYENAWELCVERSGRSAWLSVYRAGAEPRVHVYDTPIAFADVRAGVTSAVNEALSRASLPGPHAAELRAVLAALEEAPIDTSGEATDDLEALPVSVELERGGPVAFGAEFALRSNSARNDEDTERTDLHALLFRGRLSAEIRGRHFELGETHPFLVAERLVQIAEATLRAWEHGETLTVRSECAGLVLGFRMAKDGAVSLVLGGHGERALYTFPNLRALDVAEAAFAFGRSLVRALVRRDRSQGKNLRLLDFRRTLRELGTRLRENQECDEKTNPAPASYRAFASSRKTAESPTAPTRLAYSERWRALVPGLDLRATFLCGDRLVATSAHEMVALGRAKGEVLWRVPAGRATAVATPSGIARIHPDGNVMLHDLATGEPTIRAWIAPRRGGPCAGAVVSGAGLPRLLVVTEGEHHLVAIDLVTGEARWRWSYGKDGALRLKRHGRLLYATSGATALTALDVSTGAVVWRVRSRLRFSSPVQIDHELVYAVAGGTGGPAELCATCAFSGEVRFRAPIGEDGASVVEGAPLASGDHVVVARRLRRGLELVAFDRLTGALAWRSDGPVAPIGTSWLAVDGVLAGNAPTGELIGVDARTGKTIYRQTLGKAALSDVPRRLEPVLRSGALFVPFVDVHVVSPTDGRKIATIPCPDAIPDLLRVDERCDVYVAEESGHFVAYGSGPRLMLVK